MPASIDSSARLLFDEADNAVFKACKDAGQLPSVENKLGQVYQLMQSSLRPGEQTPQAAITDSIERIRKTVWHVTLLINYYDNLGKLQQFQRGDRSASRAERPDAEAAPPLHATTAFPDLPDIPSSGQSIDRPDDSVAIDMIAGAPVADIPLHQVEAKAGNVAVSTIGQVEPPGDCEPTPQGTHPGIVDLDEVDRTAIMDALRQGPTSDRKSYFTALARQKSTSIHRLLIERFNVDACATQAVLDKMIADGSVEIRVRGVAPSGKIQPCVIVI